MNRNEDILNFYPMVQTLMMDTIYGAHIPDSGPIADIILEKFPFGVYSRDPQLYIEQDADRYVVYIFLEHKGAPVYMAWSMPYDQERLPR